MILCLPFLMFQGRAQEAIDYYLDTFPDAELLEILHHPEGTEIFDPAAQSEVDESKPESEAATSESSTEEIGEAPGSFPEDVEGFSAEELWDEEPKTEDPEHGTEESHPPASQVTPGSAQPKDSAPRSTSDPWMDDTAAMETVVDWQTTLVATAQLRIGGQVLMVQDSLIKHEFDFTPSISVAVVVDTEEEFSQITDKLAASGNFLMEPGDYDFAKNFAWVQDKFGVSWQINQPLGSPEPGSDLAKDVAQAQAPDWG